jgi:hypothetical protein
MLSEVEGKGRFIFFFQLTMCGSLALNLLQSYPKVAEGSHFAATILFIVNLPPGEH